MFELKVMKYVTPDFCKSFGDSYELQPCTTKLLLLTSTERAASGNVEMTFGYSAKLGRVIITATKYKRIWQSLETEPQ